MYTSYLFAFIPPENVVIEMARYKKASEKKIGSFHGSKATVIVSLAIVNRVKPLFADAKSDRTENRIADLHPIVLYADSFKFIQTVAGDYKIYADIRKDASAEYWFKTLKLMLNLKEFMFPEIVIADRLNINQLATLWPHFMKVRIDMPFWVDTMEIYQRADLNYLSEWQPYRRFQFKLR